ncbi:hypothetical protein [Flagellimonas maritima]|uniref:hypothetical protein n=1 Tax=Flagellimonas maritima TaxID=1383885 RepID=UPI000F4F020D|nr:hypothetical protein [Allomuricauda aurantiaca]
MNILRIPNDRLCQSALKISFLNGVDIYIISKHLGHRKIRTREIHTKIIDEKIKAAANMIPELEMKIAV